MSQRTASNSNLTQAQASFSLYGYQPFQHSYITQDTAHRALVIDNAKSHGSITAGKPVERPSTSIEYKHAIPVADRTASPKPKSKAAGAFKPYEQVQVPVQTTKASTGGLLRIVEPHGAAAAKGVADSWQAHQVNIAADKTSPKSKSSHHSLVQQGLVPNPMYARVTPGSPRPAHAMPDQRHGQSTTASYVRTPSPAHMSSSSHHRPTTTALPQSAVIRENPYKPLPQPGHTSSNPMHLNHPPVSSLTQGQPLDLQSAASKRKSQDSAEDFSMKKIKQEPVVTVTSSTSIASATVSSFSQSAGVTPMVQQQQQQTASPKHTSIPNETPTWLASNKSPSLPLEGQKPADSPVTSSTTSVSSIVKSEDTSSNSSSTASTTSTLNTGGGCNPITKLKKAWLQRHSGEDTNATVTVKSEFSPVVSMDSSTANSNLGSSIVPKQQVVKTPVKESKSTVNGHGSDASSSSSSDADLDSSANKRKGTKSKQRRNSKKPKMQAEDLSDSEKNVSDVKSASEQPKKRGRRPKSKNVDEKKKPSEYPTLLYKYN